MENYRVWVGHCWDESKVKRMPASPIELLLLGSFLVAGYWLIQSGWNLLPVLAFFSSMLIAVVVITIWLLRLISAPLSIKKISRKLGQTIENRRLAQKERVIEQARLNKMNHSQWLSENFSLKKKPVAVNLKKLPVRPTFSGRVVQKFYVGYWSLKAKVCRPYAKQ